MRKLSPKMIDILVNISLHGKVRNSYGEVDSIHPNTLNALRNRGLVLLTAEGTSEMISLTDEGNKIVADNTITLEIPQETPVTPVPAPVNYGPQAAENFAHMVAQAVSAAAVAFWTRKLETL